MLPKDRHGIKEVGELARELKAESDRGAALVAASLLDDHLKEILSAFLADVPASKKLLEGAYNPLSQFAARILVAYSLGLIEKGEFQQLNTIRDIRNHFAHNWRGVSFDTQKIKDLCNNLPLRDPIPKDTRSISRQRFDSVSVSLMIHLLIRVRRVRAEKRTIKSWSPKEPT